MTVSAAASLKDALAEIQRFLSEQVTDTTVTYNFGASGALQQQIEQGAPADVFISAAKKQMDALQQKGLLLNDTRINLLKNQVVLIVPKNSSGITSFEDLRSDRVNRVALGEPKSVPAGQYAEEILTALKLDQAVKPKAVYAKDVRQALNYVETGNAAAGIVYLSDAKQSNAVKVVATAAENLHSPVIYPIAVLKNSKSPQNAKSFVRFLSGDRAKTIFEKYGFTTR